MSLIQGSIEVLTQSIFYLKHLSASEYSQEIELMSNSTIGQHSRHFIEFYQCLLAQAASLEINYCLRTRDLKIEEDPKMAILSIETILSKLEDLNLESKVFLYTSKEGGEKIPSNIARELYYNIEHCIHHLALIKIGLKIIRPDLILPESFGIAPSTLNYRKELTS